MIIVIPIPAAGRDEEKQITTMNEATRVPCWGDGSTWGQKGLVWGPSKTPPPVMSDPNVTYPVNEVLGFSTNVKAMLNNYKTQMIAAKVDPTDVIAKLGPDFDDLTTQNNVQEGIKTQLRDQTKLVEAANTKAYNDGSQGCDMVITAFGKRSEQAQEAMNLRKGVRPVARKAKSTAAKPTP